MNPAAGASELLSLLLLPSRELLSPRKWYDAHSSRIEPFLGPVEDGREEGGSSYDEDSVNLKDKGKISETTPKFGF